MRPPKHPVIDGYKQCSKCSVYKLHTLEFFVNSHSKPGSICKECSYPKGRERQLDRWRKLFPDDEAGKASWAARQREFYRTPSGKRSYRNSELTKKYGITLDQFEKLLESQGGACAICGTKEPKGRGSFNVDHDHDSGKVRSLLCHHCNTGLGAFRDDARILAKAAAYLQNHETASLDQPNTDSESVRTCVN
jgi:hypothetical protein